MTTCAAIADRTRHTPTGRRHAVARGTHRRRGACPAGRGGALLGAVVAVCIAALLVGASALPTVSENASDPSSATTTILVEPNQTLWSIASAHRLPGTTTPQTVAAIRDLNGLEGSQLTAGTTLVIPSAENAASHFAGDLPHAP